MQRLIGIVGLLCLAACQARAPGNKDVLQQGARLVKPLPGLYRSTTTLTAFELPGADPQTADTMREKFGRILPQIRETCLTKAEAEHGFQDMLEQTQQGQCTIDGFTADAGNLDAKMHCRSGDKLTSTIAVAGTAAPDRSRVTLDIDQAGPSIPGGRETISLTVDSQRVGDCPH